MKKILAVSGGVDSMVMLDLMISDLARETKDEIVAAHFDHGTRPSSKTDAEFVQRECETRKVKFVCGKGELGEGASEAEARSARYAFLERVARKVSEGEDFEICTAHHLDDVAESVVINLLRGTGWRGLAPMGNEKVRRPLMEMGWTKKDILKYAAEHEVKFRQDPTNTSDQYLRNRVREVLSVSQAQELIRLSKAQGNLRAEIDKVIFELLPKDGRYERKWFLGLDDAVAMEILRAGLLKSGVSMTRLQLMNFLTAVREYAPEKDFNLPKGRMVRMHKKDFALEIDLG